ncbi:hypothetical protein [Sphingomonas sp.]|uniref:hypothetical protein n=1 Tax=Sphingomonas sp. TaxID=28214 RepID=UPI003BAB1C7E
MSGDSAGDRRVLYWVAVLGLLVAVISAIATLGSWYRGENPRPQDPVTQPLPVVVTNFPPPSISSPPSTRTVPQAGETVLRDEVPTANQGQGQLKAVDTAPDYSASSEPDSVYDAIEFPVEVKAGEISLRKSNYQFQQPDLIGYEATVTLSVRNKSNRTLRIGWLDPFDNLRLHFKVGPEFKGSHRDYKGLPICTMSPGHCDNDRRSAPIEPSEVVTLVAVLSGSVTPKESVALEQQKFGSVVGQLVIVPRGTRPEYGKQFSLNMNVQRDSETSE